MKTEGIVAVIINGWDPVGLLAGGAPSNEYDIEIKEISKRINLTTTEIELAKIIYDTFKNKMGIELNHLNCLKYAFRTIQDLKHNKGL
ncbi:hypothetical protein ACTHPF_15205 [Paenibacillus sp. SAF-054]|uniref:hypothetical protein n=1 Tax=unclassified Paenibacillus TaxID=185978 RepID=UPI003F7F3C38